MKHRYITWEGRYRGRHFIDMHIVDHLNKPICKTWRPASAEYEKLWNGRPDGRALCRNCMRARAAFEEQEKLRTWQGISSVEVPE